ncbi:MAG: biotin carboxylase [Acidimicrobiaceae bacterium]|nr:biotin carboxylase [Acidimicrobiaceae bacterium]
MPRALLILPTATYRAPGFLAAAERLGTEVVTASERPQAMAGAMGDRFLEIDLSAPEKAAQAIVELNDRLKLDAVLAVDDQGLLAAAMAAERLGLRHDPPGAVVATRDKALMRARFAEHRVPQARFAVIPPTGGRSGQLDALVRAADRLGYPAVVKPCSLSASRGVIRVDDAAQARSAAERVFRILEEANGTAQEPLLVESYLPGDEVALEAICSGGRLQPLAIFDKPDPLEGPYFEETLYVTPSRHPVPVQADVVQAAQAAVSALGLAEGPVHAEVRIAPADGSGKRSVAVLEVAGRTIGGRCAAALRFFGGASLEELVLAHALGSDLPTVAAPGASGVLMLPIPASGRLKAVEGRDRALAVEGITGLEITVPMGAKIRALPEADRYLGFLFARGDTPELVEAALRRAHAALEITIVAETGAA